MYQTSKPAIVRKNLTSQDPALKTIREAAVSQYQRYQTQLNHIDRQFQLELKKSGQQANRSVSRFGDTISCLNSELAQLNGQYASYSQKLETIRQRQRDLSTSGVLTVITPVKTNFASFEEEFNRALANVDSLIRTWSSRVSTVKTDYQSLKPLPQTLNFLNSAIEGLGNASRQTSANLFTVNEEMTTLIAEERRALSQRIQDRIMLFRTQIHNVEQRSLTAFNQSQNVAADAQALQFEIRHSFDRTVERARSNLKSRLLEVRKRIRDLTDMRAAQVQEIRNRISDMNVDLAKTRRRKERQNVDLGIDEKPKNSVRAEIDAIRERITQLEQILAGKTRPQPKQKRAPVVKPEVKPRPEGVRVFFNVLEDGSLKLIIVDQNGVVHLPDHD
jgi:chromosome segregation ATPase